MQTPTDLSDHLPLPLAVDEPRRAPDAGRRRHGPALTASMIAAACVLLGGCGVTVVQPRPLGQSLERARVPVVSQTSGNAVVFTQPAVDQWYAARGVSDAERYEFARRDELLSVGTRAPLEASRQWPVVLGPHEHPVQFQRWRQQPGP